MLTIDARRATDADAPDEEDDPGPGSAQSGGLSTRGAAIIVAVAVGGIPAYAVSQWLLSRSLWFAPVVLALGASLYLAARRVLR